MFFDILWIVRKQKLYVRLLAARRVVLQQFRSEEEIELMSLFGIVQCTCKPFKVKVDKGVRWMPRHTVAMKDVPSCDKLRGDRKSTRLNSSHVAISYAVFCLKKK